MDGLVAEEFWEEGGMVEEGEGLFIVPDMQ
jgi:hypothetical protein